MVNLSFTQEQWAKLCMLLDNKPGKQPTADQLIAVLERGSAAGMELTLSSRSGRKKTPCCEMLVGRQLDAAKGGF